MAQVKRKTIGKKKENGDIRNALGSYLIVHSTADEKAEEIARLHGIHIGEARSSSSWERG